MVFVYVTFIVEVRAFHQLACIAGGIVRARNKVLAAEPIQTTSYAGYHQLETFLFMRGA